MPYPLSGTGRIRPRTGAAARRRRPGARPGPGGSYHGRGQGERDAETCERGRPKRDPDRIARPYGLKGSSDRLWTMRYVLLDKRRVILREFSTGTIRIPHAGRFRGSAAAVRRPPAFSTGTRILRPKPNQKYKLGEGSTLSTDYERGLGQLRDRSCTIRSSRGACRMIDGGFEV